MSNPRHVPSQANPDNRARQLGPENDAYWKSRGYDERPDDWEDLASNSKLRRASHEAIFGIGVNTA